MALTMQPFSSTTAFRPARCASMAASRPTGPAPTMIRSAWLVPGVLLLMGSRVAQSRVSLLCLQRQLPACPPVFAGVLSETVPVRAPVPDGAGGAARFPGGADAPAVQDERVVRKNPVLLRARLLQVFLHPVGIVAPAEREPPRQSPAVRVHRNGGDVKEHAEHHVCGFASH